MYSRREQDNINLNRSYGPSHNEDLTHGAQRKFDASKSDAQQMNCGNRNSKLDFSIFHGPNSSSLQRKPVQLNEMQDQSFNDIGDRSHPKQQSYVQRDSFGQSEQLQQSFSRNSAFTKPKTAEVFNGNTRTLRPSTPVSTNIDGQRQNRTRNAIGNMDYQHSNPTSSNTSSNTLGFMGVPKPNKYTPKTQSSSTSSVNMSKMNETSEGSGKATSRGKRYGNTDGERLCIFTGTVERVIKWGKIFQNHFCYFEVIAAVISIADGKVQFERTMLLRDRTGPILQVTYYSNATHINIEDFHLGQMLRVVGRIIGPNIMSAITIRATTNEEIENFPRMYYISDRAISTMMCSNN